ncbi:MAG: hypothetical protein ACPG4T_19565, partial [Nannocystaceae bacterium]
AFGETSLDAMLTKDPSCAKCHAYFEPMASSFRRYDAAHQEIPSDPVWFDVYKVGCGEMVMPEDDNSDPLAWFARECLVDDQRFAHATVKWIVEALTGAPPLTYPHSGHPDFAAALNAWHAQNQWIRDVEETFINAGQDGYDLRALIVEVTVSPYYRAAALSPEALGLPAATYQALGTDRLLTPERLAHKIHAIFGEPWVDEDGNEKTPGAYNLLLGGIDSDTVTMREREFNAVKDSVSLRMGLELACQHVALDFSRPPEEQRLFLEVDLEDYPGSGVVEWEDAARKNIVHLHSLILGEELDEHHKEVDATLELFTSLQQAGQVDVEEWIQPNDPDAADPPWRLAEACQSSTIVDDPDYVVRAWMGVITYLISDYRFLYSF